MKKEYFNFTFFYTEKDAKIQTLTIQRVETEQEAILDFFRIVKAKNIIDYFIIQEQVKVSLPIKNMRHNNEGYYVKHKNF